MEICKFIKNNYNNEHPDFETILYLLEKSISYNIPNISIYLDNHLYEKDGLYSSLNNTKTIFGNILLQSCLLRIENNTQELLNRQSLIQYITNFSSDLDNYLEDIRHDTDDLLWLWKKKNDEEQKSLQFIYFNKGLLLSLNHFLPALQISSVLKLYINPIQTIISPIFLMIIPYIFIKKQFNLNLSFCSYCKFLTNIMIKPMFTFRNKMEIVNLLISIMSYGFGLYNLYSNCKMINDITNLVHKKMIILNKLILKCKEFKRYIPDNLRYLIDPNNDINNDRILENDLIFTTEPGYFNDKGKIAYMYYQFSLIPDKYTPYLAIIGRLDMFNSLFKLKCNHFEYSTYIKYKRPILWVKELWHPTIGYERSTKNSIVMGKHNNHILLTGPNATGKSTFIKNVLICILLSQTIGLSPCSGIKLTPFYYVNSYIEIPDKEGYESLYQAEINRCYSLLNNITAYQKKGLFSFIIMDEIFNSTNYIEAISAAYSICYYLFKKNMLLSIITTHYGYLTRIESDCKGIINYKMNLDRDNGEIIFNYKITKGISDEYIALELFKKKNFAKKIVDKAYKIQEDIRDKFK